MSETRASYDAGAPSKPAQREIKFRLFVPEKFNPETDTFAPGFEYFTLAPKNEIWFTEERWPPDQFTGLKDRTGREIYESDILQFHDGAIGVVGWENGRFTIFNRPEKSMVIGNIHENPELVK